VYDFIEEKKIKKSYGDGVNSEKKEVVKG